MSVTQSALAMGPFDGDALDSAKGPKVKVWLGTKRKNVSGNAHLTVTGPNHRSRSYTRKEASARGYTAFYPGLIDITEPGIWVITADVGPDTLCVRVNYR